MRTLTDAEVHHLLAADSIARLATVDEAGYPHVTPVWFLWLDGEFLVTSHRSRPHLARIRANPRVGVVVDAESEQRSDGERPNRQVRIVGEGTVSTDSDGEWTRRIRRKYLDETLSPGAVERALHRDRAVITIKPRLIRGVASV